MSSSNNDNHNESVDVDDDNDNEDNNILRGLKMGLFEGDTAKLEVFRFACISGNKLALEFMLDSVKSAANHQEQLRLFAACLPLAVRNDFPNMVEFLLLKYPQLPVLKSDACLMFKQCCYRDFVSLAKLLAERFSIDRAANNNNYICIAMEEGSRGMVKWLLEDKQVDPSARENHLLRKACFQGDIATIRLLLSDPRFYLPDYLMRDLISKHAERRLNCLLLICAYKHVIDELCGAQQTNNGNSNGSSSSNTYYERYSERQRAREDSIIAANIFAEWIVRRLDQLVSLEHDGIDVTIRILYSQYVASITHIQRLFVEKLYAPPRGRFYRRAVERWKTAAAAAAA